MNLPGPPVSSAPGDNRPSTSGPSLHLTAEPLTDSLAATVHPGGHRHPRARQFLSRWSRRPGHAGIAVLLAVVVLAASGRCGASDADQRQLAVSIGTLPGPSLVRPAVGHTGQHFIAAWRDPAGDGVRVRVLGQSDSDAGPLLHIPDLTAALGIIPTAGGALIVGIDQFVTVLPDGRTAGPVRQLEDPPEAIGRAPLLDGDRLVIATTNPVIGGPDQGAVHRVSLHQYDLEGRTAAAPVTVERDRFPSDIALARLPTGDYLLVWSEAPSEGPPYLTSLIVNRQGVVVRELLTLYTARRGGALVNLRAVSAPDGRVMLVWQDSSPGAWEIFTMPVGAGGPLSEARQQSVKGSDDLDPVLLSDGDRLLVAWHSGLHYGLFSRRGSGSVSVRGVEGPPERRVYRAPGSVELFSAAAHGGSLAVVAVARKANALTIHASVGPIDGPRGR